MTNEHSVLSAAQVDELLLDSQRLRTEVKRLEAVEREAHRCSELSVVAAAAQGRAEGIKAAANKIEGLMAPDDWSKAEADAAYRFSYILAERLRATAHDKPESDTTTHRDGGDTKETT